jgi:hypothetical protein
MNQPQPFLRFTDHNLMDFAVGLGMGLNLPKTSRIREIEAQEGNAFVQYPFGYYESGGNWFNRFANDNDWQVPGPCKLAPVQRIPALTKWEQVGKNYFSAVLSVLSNSETSSDIKNTIAPGLLPAGLPYTAKFYEWFPDYFEIALTEGGINRSLHLIGQKVSGKWYAQWFIAFQPTAIVEFYQAYFTPPLSPNLPLDADLSGFTFQSDFLDLDFCDFSEPPLQEYFLPAKQGDVFQINIPVEGTNLPENGELSAALVDCEGNEIPMQSEIVWVSCVQTYETKILYDFSTNQFFEWFGTYTGATFQPSYLKVYAIDPSLNKEFLVEFSLNIVPGQDILVGITVNSFCTQLEALLTSFFGYACEVTFTGGSGLTDRPEITIKITSDLCNVVAIDFDFTYTFPPEVITAVGLYNPITCKTEGTQYQATLIIPFTLPDGTYKIAITDNYTGAVYCFSNIIQVDSTDEFSQIIQFQGNNIAEGFEYFNGWFQQVRMGINGAGPEFENQVSVYRDSNGNSRSTSVRTDLILNLHTNWIDDPTLKALQSATNHRTFNIGTQSLYVTDFEVGHNQDFSTITSYFGLAQVKIKAKKQNYQPINQGCVNC